MASDSQSMLGKAEEIRQHEARRREENLKDEDGGLRLETLLRLHRSSPRKRRCFAMQDGDVWETMHKAITEKKARGDWAHKSRGMRPRKW